MLRAVWEGRIVSESALTTRINAARYALGDDGTVQRLVRTFIRKGIRFIGEVTEVVDDTFAISCARRVAAVGEAFVCSAAVREPDGEPSRDIRRRHGRRDHDGDRPLSVALRDRAQSETWTQGQSRRRREGGA